jgi:hypothetical protein
MNESKDKMFIENDHFLVMKYFILPQLDETISLLAHDQKFVRKNIFPHFVLSCSMEAILFPGTIASLKWVGRLR